jgi:hypothetical protein
MFLKRRLVAFLGVIATSAVGVPAAPASAGAVPVRDPAAGSLSCPAWYAGPTNLATGCPYWIMSPAP